MSSKYIGIRLRNMLFILPLLLINMIGFIIPFCKTVYMSFFDWQLLGEKKFIWFQNFVSAFTNEKFHRALIFTGKYVLLVTPMLLVMSFIMTILVNQKFKGVGIFRTIYFLPVVISMTACSNVWLWIYDHLHGILNHILLSLGVIEKNVAWMNQPDISLPAICVMITWKMSGFSMLMLLGAMQAIDDEIYQAAKIDGANAVQRFFRVTIPLIRANIGLSLVISVIGSVLAFEQFRIMTNGGPSSKTMTVVHYIYETSFKHFKFGYGAAMALILMVIILLLSRFQFSIMKDAT